LRLPLFNYTICFRVGVNTKIKMLSVIPKIEQLSQSVIRVLGCNPGPMTLQGTNTYVVGTGAERLLIDTGEEDREKSSLFCEQLKTCLNDYNFSIKAVILTHWHHDHIGGLTTLKNQKIISTRTPLYKFPLGSDDSPGSREMAYTFVRDKSIIEAEGATLKVLYTPGHTQDHIALLLLEENAVFTGDCILGEGTAVFEDLYDYMKSLEKIGDLNPKILYPGHGKVITEPSIVIKHYIDHRNQREQQIISCLSSYHPEAMESMQIVKEVYKDVPVHLHLPADVNVQNHLGKLKKEGKVKEKYGKWSLTSKL